MYIRTRAGLKSETEEGEPRASRVAPCFPESSARSRSCGAGSPCSLAQAPSGLPPAESEYKTKCTTMSGGKQRPLSSRTHDSLACVENGPCRHFVSYSSVSYHRQTWANFLCDRINGFLNASCYKLILQSFSQVVDSFLEIIKILALLIQIKRKRFA